MPPRLLDYSYIAATVILTVYGQLIFKWRVGKLGAQPEDSVDKLKFLFLAVFDPGILSGLVAAFLASMSWMVAMNKFELSHAYPFTGLSFVLVLALSAWLLNEPITWPKAVGVALIVLGTIVASRG